MTAAGKGGGAHAPSDRLLSAKEAADYLGISVKRLYEFCRDGSLRHLRLADTAAGVLRFRRQWLDSWAEAKASGGRTVEGLETDSARDLTQRFWVSDHYPGDHNPLATADTLAEALAAASRIRSPHNFLVVNGIYPDRTQLMINDRGAGFTLVWAGTPEQARDPRLLAPCTTCGHLGVDHWTALNVTRHGACRWPGCACEEFTR